MHEDIRIGEILDEKYLLVRMLGGGAFGDVYLAQDILLEEHYVALKSLKIDEAEREQLLIREMDFLAKLADPHVVGFYHHFKNRNSLFMVMEYCPGGTLRQILHTQDKIKSENATGWIVQLCETLQRVHDHDIVHHDLKPENILFSTTDAIKIADFGVANTRGRDTSLYVS